MAVVTHVGMVELFVSEGLNITMKLQGSKSKANHVELFY